MPYYETGDTVTTLHSTLHSRHSSYKIHFKLQFSTRMDTVEHGSCHADIFIQNNNIQTSRAPDTASRVNKSDPRCSGECFG